MSSLLLFIYLFIYKKEGKHAEIFSEKFGFIRAMAYDVTLALNILNIMSILSCLAKMKALNVKFIKKPQELVGKKKNTCSTVELFFLMNCATLL